MKKQLKPIIASFILTLSIFTCITNLSTTSLTITFLETRITNIYDLICIAAYVISITCMCSAITSFILIICFKNKPMISNKIQSVFMIVNISFLILLIIIQCIFSFSSNYYTNAIESLEYQTANPVAIGNYEDEYMGYIIRNSIMSELYKDIILGFLFTSTLPLLELIFNNKNKSDNNEVKISTQTTTTIKDELTKDIQKMKDELEIQKLKEEYKTLYTTLQNTKKEP